MAQASKAEEPSMEEILASIRRIISDEDAEGANGAEDADAVAGTAEDIGTDGDMDNSAELSQDDLDKLFDEDGSDDDAVGDSGDAADLDEMAAAMEADAAGDTDEDVLELTEDLAVVEEGDIELVDGMSDDLASLDSDISFVDNEPEESFPEPVMETPVIEAAPIPEDLPEVADDAPLTSDGTGEAVHAAFDNLANMFVGSQAQTVEELVKEMLRPMLKAWLDQNLPPMVEEMVQKEIQRVTRRR